MQSSRPRSPRPKTPSAPGSRPSPRRRRADRAGAAFVVSVVGLLATGCAEQVPARPVPQPEAKPELPGWYPEKPWTEQRTERVYLEGKVVFDTARWTLRPESERVLKQLLEYLQANPDISRIRLEGHTDDRAGEEYNQGLSVHRAMAVADWLVDHGLDNMRLLAVAFGESRPLRSNASPEGRQENRRASFHIAEVSGTRFLGRDPANGGLVLEVLSKEDRDRETQVGKVPVVKEEPWTPTRDVIAPVERPKLPESEEDEPAPTTGSPTGTAAPTTPAATTPAPTEPAPKP